MYVSVATATLRSRGPLAYLQPPPRTCGLAASCGPATSCGPAACGPGAYCGPAESFPPRSCGLAA